LLVLTDRPGHSDKSWKFDVESFFEEAKVTTSGIEVLRSRFDKFCSVSEDGRGETFLSFDDFHRINAYYGICKPREEEHMCRAMDQQGHGCIRFQDFLMGCAAASPTCQHILNSHTGLVRARYIFKYFNASQSGTLDYEELAALLADMNRPLDEPDEVQRSYTVGLAQELGDVSVTTLRVTGLSGALCDIRVSTRWTGLRVRREIARELQVPIEGQELLLGNTIFSEDEVLENVIPAGATSVTVTLVRSQSWDDLRWPYATEPSITDGMVGLERLVHVTFERFYGAMVGEQLRGTSRLFRLHRNIMHTRKSICTGKSAQPAKSALGGA